MDKFERSFRAYVKWFEDMYDKYALSVYCEPDGGKAN